MEKPGQGNQAYELGLARVGKDVIIWPLAKLVQPDVISIGDCVIIDDFTFIVGGRRTELGSFVHIASFVSVTGGGEFIVSDFANISTGTKILTGTDNFTGANLMGPVVPDRYRDVERSFVRLERFTTVGASSVVLPGVTIGEGAVIGAGSVVLRSCEPWCIYVGVPARLLRRRPPEDIAIIKALGDEVWEDTHDGATYIPRRMS